jgi:uncharacterized membrane protein
VTGGFLFAAVFLACAVEAVEALTIVLAVGVTRSWRSTLFGVGAGLVLLAAIIGALGPALLLIPIHILQLVIGGLLLTFGLQWLKKAILRASGLQSKRDEASIYERETASATAAPRSQGHDWYSFTIAFKGVVLEGLEVAFIVLTFGSNQGNIPLAVVAAVAACVAVIVVGVLVQAPLTRIPENTLKYAVGLMLFSFGAFWGAEGAGAKWPGSDAAILAILATVTLVSLGTTQLLAQFRRRAQAASTKMPASAEAGL